MDVVMLFLRPETNLYCPQPLQQVCQLVLEPDIFGDSVQGFLQVAHVVVCVRPAEVAVASACSFPSVGVEKSVPAILHQEMVVSQVGAGPLLRQHVRQQTRAEFLRQV